MPVETEVKFRVDDLDGLADRLKTASSIFHYRSSQAKRLRASSMHSCLWALLLLLAGCGHGGGSIDQLKDKDSGVRSHAAQALAGVKNPRAVEPLIAALKDPDSGVRGWAAFALGESKDPRAVEPLIATLKDPHSGVRAFAAAALRVIGDPRAVEPLIVALKDPDSEVRGAAIEGLAALKDHRAIEPLIAASQDADPSIRRIAIYELGQFEDSRTALPLMVALKDPDYRVREEAAKALPEDLLAKGLNKYGNREIARSLLNSEEPKLRNAASEWATGHGYRVD